MDLEKEYSLFILLGFDLLYRINLNQLRPKLPNSENKELVQWPPLSKSVREQLELTELEKLPEEFKTETELSLVFCHFTHPDYPLGMGLFSYNSKLHFFGGQNLQESAFRRFLYDGNSFVQKEPIEPGSNWLNKKVFTFTPNLYGYGSPEEINEKLIIVRDKSTDPLPNHNSYKVRPIVFTIADNVYAFATKPFLTTLLSVAVAAKELSETLNLFEVFEPDKNKWTELPNPPTRLYEAMLGDHFPLIRHCVYKTFFILESDGEQFIFDTKQRDWLKETYVYPPDYDLEPYPTILASLEYNDDHLLVFFRLGNAFNLVAYPKSSFESFPWKSRESYTVLLSLDDIDEYNRHMSIPLRAASLSLVENNRVCFVFNRFGILHVCLLEVNDGVTVATLEAHQKFVLPNALLRDDAHTLSTFIIQHVEEYVSVFVSDLPCTITTADILLREFQRFGKIKPGGVFLNCEKNFGFVEFEDVQSHDKAIEASSIHFAGKKVYVEEVYKARLSNILWWRRRKAEDAI